MPGQISVTVAIGPQKSTGFVLKKTMNIPPPNILEGQDDGENHKPAKIRIKYTNRSVERVFVSLAVHLASPPQLRADWSLKRTERSLRRVLLYHHIRLLTILL